MVIKEEERQGSEGRKRGLPAAHRGPGNGPGLRCRGAARLPIMRGGSVTLSRAGRGVRLLRLVSAGCFRPRCGGSAGNEGRWERWVSQDPLGRRLRASPGGRSRTGTRRYRTGGGPWPLPPSPPRPHLALVASMKSASGEPGTGWKSYIQLAESGNDIRMDSVRPPVFRPNVVPRS